MFENKNCLCFVYIDDGYVVDWIVFVVLGCWVNYIICVDYNCYIDGFNMRVDIIYFD